MLVRAQLDTIVINWRSITFRGHPDPILAKNHIAVLSIRARVLTPLNACYTWYYSAALSISVCTIQNTCCKLMQLGCNRFNGSDPFVLGQIIPDLNASNYQHHRDGFHTDDGVLQ